MGQGTAITHMMTTEEARQCADGIRRGMSDVRHLLLDFHEREGWRALNYESWRECAMAEFGYGQSHVYELLNAARVERNISATAETPLPERQLRHLAPLAPEVQREVWTRATETAPGGKVTAKHVEQTVIEWKAGNSTELGERGSKSIDTLPPSPYPPIVTPDGDIPDTVTLRVARVVYLLTIGRHMKLGEIASITGLTENGAWRLMNRLAGGHHVPVTEYEGRWCIVDVDASDMAF